ncbi:FAD-dependent oxidoreductase [Solwaraspora sp. WMMD1047]|uniref:FAD-dependent oxidoreductase n=1 Tax=Solwaraspora sp. WMMD1047 TaxID=3016102 RepID=UPI002415C217|nr:FAD-dependent oxidoreductase [Solwaraspora sp. WMMD1047]MDG4829359.1 FAD-dependent oxidoreductase [Solwaraspora sp. WMMD1047]
MTGSERDLPGRLRSTEAHQKAETHPGTPFEFTFGTEVVPALPGETIGAALLAAGVRSWRQSRHGRRPRTLFCGIGACFDCLVTVDGGPAVRACLTPAEPAAVVAAPGPLAPPGTLADPSEVGIGPACPVANRAGPVDLGSGSVGTIADRAGPSEVARVAAGGVAGRVGPSGMRRRTAGTMADEPAGSDVDFAPVDVVVVGAGPAGSAAALAAADAGCRVTVIDSGAAPGGQYHRQPPRQFAAGRPAVPHPGDPAAPQPSDPAAPHPGDGGRARLRRQPAAAPPGELAGHPLISLRPGRTVWAAEPGSPYLRLRLTGGGVLRARAVVIATGGHDLALPFPGWDLPGVLTAGGLQALVKGQLVLPGRRVVVAGTGPFLLPVAVTLVEAGARVLGVFEANHPGGWLGRLPALAGRPGALLEATRYLRTLRRHRVPVRHRHAVVAAHGHTEVEAVTVARLGPDWTPLPGRRHRLAVDAVGVGFGFVASVELPLALGCATRPGPGGLPVVRTDPYLRTSVPGVYAAGEVTGVGGAQLAAVEGRLAGRTAAADLGRSRASAAEAGVTAATRPAGDTAGVSGGDPTMRAGRVEVAALLRKRDRLQRFADALHGVYAVRPGWRSWLRDDTLVCRCEEVPASRLRHAATELAVTEARAAKLTTRVAMGMCQGRICGPAVAALLAGHTGRPVDPTPMANRPIGVPVPLGLLAAATEPADPDTSPPPTSPEPTATGTADSGPAEPRPAAVGSAEFEPAGTDGPDPDHPTEKRTTP